WPASSLPGGEPSRLGLAMRQDVLTCRTHTGVAAISSQLVEKGELPDRSSVLGRLAWPRLHPEHSRLLRGKNGGDGIGLHGGGVRPEHVWRIRWLIKEGSQRHMARRGRLIFEQPRQRIPLQPAPPRGHITSLLLSRRAGARRSYHVIC